MRLVSNHSIVGTTRHNHHIYMLYFSKNGDLTFLKNEDVTHPYYGKWYVKDGHITSEIFHFKGPNMKSKMKYFHIQDNVYGYSVVSSNTDRKNSKHSPFIVYDYQLPSFKKIANAKVKH